MSARYLIVQRAAAIAQPTAVIRLGRATLIACHDVPYAPAAPHDLLITDVTPAGEAKAVRGPHARLDDTERGLFISAPLSRGLRFASPPGSTRVDGAPVRVEPGVSFLVHGMRYTVADDCKEEVEAYAKRALGIRIDRSERPQTHAGPPAGKEQVIGAWQAAPIGAPQIDWQHVPSHVPPSVASASAQVFYLALAGGNPGTAFGMCVALTERPKAIELLPLFLTHGVVSQMSYSARATVRIRWSNPPRLLNQHYEVGVDEPLHLERYSLMLRSAPVPWVPGARLTTGKQKIGTPKTVKH